MKSASLKKVKSINNFIKNKIKNTEAIIGGGGPIDRDKIKTKRR